MDTGRRSLSQQLGSRSSKQSDQGLHDLMARFRVSRTPIPINFRELVTLSYNSERATHLVHPYPAKLLVHIPYYFLSCETLVVPGETVADPFCGSGTVLLEGALHGCALVGADSNPLALAITTAKLTLPNSHLYEKVSAKLATLELSKLRKSNVDVVNLDYWFTDRIQRELAAVWEVLSPHLSESGSSLLTVTFSQCARKLSLADPKFSVPVKLRPEKYRASPALFRRAHRHEEWLSTANARDTFISLLQANYRRQQELLRLVATAPLIEYLGTDARFLRSDYSYHSEFQSVKGASVDLVLTSPPYAGAQKYIRSSSLSLGWLGLWPSRNLRALEDRSIGREHFSKRETLRVLNTGDTTIDEHLRQIRSKSELRAHLVATYLLEMAQSLREMYRILKPGKYAVIVIGDNQVCGGAFPTARYLANIAEAIGFVLALHLVDDIRSRGLMTKRNKSSGVIATESVLLFQKQ